MNETTRILKEQINEDMINTLGTDHIHQLSDNISVVKDSNDGVYIATLSGVQYMHKDTIAALHKFMEK